LSAPSTETLPRPLGRPFDESKSDVIVAAARALFFERGFGATSIEEVARRAGVSKVTVYNRFSDKQTLFVECISAECRGMEADLKLDMGAPGDLRGHLIRFGEVMNAFLNRPELVRFENMLGGEMDRHPEMGKLFLNAGPRRMKGGLARVIAGGVERGEIIVEDVPAAAELLGSMLKGFADIERRFDADSDGHFMSSERIAYAVDVFLKAHRPD
jgi:TetR/AcrR family transcriptional regulator, mexJK operon transcriptional repressor